jgi:adenylyl- and sulfurtransferase ThiI
MFVDKSTTLTFYTEGVQRQQTKVIKEAYRVTIQMMMMHLTEGCCASTGCESVVM